jgi:hypothetical protein
MMASIPNMRSAPLPVQAAPGAPGGEAVPGDFAAQMPVPAVPVQSAEPVLSIAAAPVDSEMPCVPPIDGAPEGEADDTAETKAETAQTEPPVPAVVIPFLPVQPATPGPRAQPTVSAEEAAPVETPAAPAPRPDRATKGGKPPLPRVAKAPVEPKAAPPASNDAPAGKEDMPAADAALVEAAVKELLQRKQVPAKPVAAAPKAEPADAAKADAKPVQAQPKVTAPSQTTASVPSPLPVADQVQPALAPVLPQIAPVKADAAAPVEGTRTTDLAVERQLDLARETEWLDRLARDIARAGANDAPLRFRLHPQTLGSLHVELQQGDHGTAVRLTVETEAARQILTDAQPRLAAEARAQGVRIAETHVDLSGSGRHAPGDQRRQDEARQTPLIRTARGAGAEAVASARSTGRARLDRYA